jgi:hypothetical protein
MGATSDINISFRDWLEHTGRAAKFDEAVVVLAATWNEYEKHVLANHRSAMAKRRGD